ncbi:MAG: Crp/Fnr family transcriptional regulator [Heliobacteriaceae bacterium]|nr:Crp/Fnr family transcriptional regulator [Heliobacteriaceae bacterium]
MLACLRPVVSTYHKQECLFIAGDKLAGIGVVLAGKVMVTKENAAGNRVIMGVFGPGEIFAEIAVFSGKGVSPATVYAQETCTVMFLSPEKITTCEKMCPCHRQLVINLLHILSEKALLLNRKVEYLAIKSLRAKICTFLLEQHKKSGRAIFTLPLKRDQLAEFLNVSRPSLSRELGRMRDEGLIDFHRSAVKIKNIATLKRMTE